MACCALVRSWPSVDLALRLCSKRAKCNDNGTVVATSTGTGYASEQHPKGAKMCVIEDSYKGSTPNIACIDLYSWYQTHREEVLLVFVLIPIICNRPLARISVSVFHIVRDTTTLATVCRGATTTQILWYTMVRYRTAARRSLNLDFCVVIFAQSIRDRLKRAPVSQPSNFSLSAS